MSDSRLGQTTQTNKENYWLSIEILKAAKRLRSAIKGKQMRFYHPLKHLRLTKLYSLKIVIAWLFLWVVVKRQLFEPCENKLQCDGTEDAGACRKVGRHSFCFCNKEHVEYEGRCFKGRVFLVLINAKQTFWCI